MSMYGMLFERNKHSSFILAMLGLTEQSVGRFRDAFISDGEIAIYTRNGGGNRDCWDAEQPTHDSGECPCAGCVITYRLPKHPNYLRDQDDDFDSTYATIYFSIPPELAEIAKGFDSGSFNGDARWAAKLDEIKASSGETLRQKYPQLAEIVEQIANFVDKSV